MILGTSTSHWVHDLSPFLWQFPDSWGNWGPGGIRWYGISYLIGFITAYALLLRAFRYGKSPYDKEQVINLMTFMVIGVLVGGRMGYILLYQTSHFIDDPLLLLRVWEGGMASHGGFVGVILAIYWYIKQSRQMFWPVADLIASVVPPGLCFGRLANFINGELWGKPSECAWAVLFPKSPGFAEGIARHPSQIYAALLEGVLVFTFVQFRFWKSNICQKCPGRLGGEFLIAYALARIVGEFFREPDASLILGMSRGQFYSIFLFIGGFVVIGLASRRATQTHT